MFFDVFNGDADGLCALHQLRLAAPRQAELVTGVKRDIALLKRVQASAGDEITVLDIAVEKNAAALGSLLEQGARVRWFDHHNPGELPSHPNFEPHIDTAAEVCTSLLVDRALGGAQRIWAVVAAFGDNLAASAIEAARPLGLAEAQLAALKELGECLNYNGYGETLADLHFDPAELYRALHPHADPFAFIATSPAFATLRHGYAADMALAGETRPIEARHSAAIYSLPDAPWARRVSGVYANDLACASPDKAHALLTLRSDGDYVVSVRAPLANRTGADTLCMQFPTGGGRKAAAGINRLPANQLDDFARAFFAQYPG